MLSYSQPVSTKFGKILVGEIFCTINRIQVSSSNPVGVQLLHLQAWATDTMVTFDVLLLQL